MPRIAIIDKDKCKPEKCSKECIKICPPQKIGKHVIDIEDIATNVPTNTNKSDMVKVDINKIKNLTDKKKIAKIAESLCIGCNQCVRVCPFEAIKIINLPEENPADIVHRYSANGFRLYKLPILKPNTIIGIIGSNGVGKTTLIEILSKKIRPNFELFNKVLSDKEIITKFRGTVLQDYLKDLYGDKIKFSIKEQKIKQNITMNNIKVKEFLKSKLIDIDLMESLPESFYYLEINKIIDSNLLTLSGGELQRLLCWITAIQDADVYIFDEPSNFLDVKQRLEISKLIKSIGEINGKSKYIIVIEHDLSMLDYISDELYIVYGRPGAYGIVSKPLTTLEGINMYLSGYISTQNIRFRDEEFNLKPSNEIVQNNYEKPDKQENQEKQEKQEIISTNIFKYPSHLIEFPGYNLQIPAGSIIMSNSINVILGENGTGKTTFINWLAKSLGLSVSIKEQSTNIKRFANKDGLYPTVLELFHHKIKSNYFNPTFQTDVIKSLEIEELVGRRIDELSGGELQRVFIVLCLGTPADIYLLDEPSANLDIEKRLKITKVIKRFIINYSKTAYVIEHDIMMSVAFAQEYGSKILLVKQDSYDNGIKKCSISEPLEFTEGINGFLKLMGITMRISSHNRPRINKFGSQLDQEQKKTGKYYGF
jgi:ATP-binding cassette subfamily E protein 1